jgi:hypothetical protein
MPIMARDKGNFVPAPAGTHAAVCVDVEDLGLVKIAYADETSEKHMIYLHWQIDELNGEGYPFRVRKRYNLSLHEKATLRKDLESWRGRAFSTEELHGFDVEVLIGVPALLSVIHNPGRSGGVFANVQAIMRLPKSMTAPEPDSTYIRVCNREKTKSIPVGAMKQDADYGPPPPFPTDDFDEVPF